MRTAQGEEEFLISSNSYPQQESLGITDSFDSSRSHHGRRRSGSRDFWLTLLFALGIFGISTGAARFLFPRSASTRQPDPSRTGLVSKTDSDDEGGYTTDMCAGDASLPVLEGVDVVSYFSLEETEPAVLGKQEHEAEYNGYRFWFASAENRAAFEGDPLRYMPAWGGFCSWGMSEEDWWTAETLGPDTDPNAWLITDDGILHVFRSELPKHKFMKNIAENIKDGNEQWSDWFGASLPAAGFGNGSPLNTACFCSVDTCSDN